LAVLEGGGSEGRIRAEIRLRQLREAPDRRVRQAVAAAHHQVAVPQEFGCQAKLKRGSKSRYCGGVK
jgi:hypothetical protein